MTRGDRRECPSCGSHETDHAHWEHNAREVEEVRQCENCPVQYTNRFTKMEVRIDSPEEFMPDDEFTQASDLRSGGDDGS